MPFGSESAWDEHELNHERQTMRHVTNAFRQ